MNTLIRAVCSLYYQCQHLVPIIGSKLDQIAERDGLRQGCPLFQFLLDKISSSGLGQCFLQMTSSCWHCLTVISNSDWNSSQLSAKPPGGGSARKRWNALFRSRMRSCPKNPEILFTGEGWMEREIDRWFGAASEVIQILRSSVVVKKELSQKSKLWEVTERMRWQMQTGKLAT